MGKTSSLRLILRVGEAERKKKAVGSRQGSAFEGRRG